MTELTDLNDTDALNTAVTGNSTEGNTANMGGMDNLFQATLGMLSRFRNSNVFRLRDNTDKTKLLAFDLSGLSPGTRTQKVQNLNGTLAIGGQQICQGRLTLTAGVAVPTSNTTGASTVYFTPYRGNQVGLYTGSDWVFPTFSELSIALSGGTASRPHDVFLDYNSGTPALAILAWTNDTTRATALTSQDGILVKSGAPTQRYLGTVYLDASKQCEDSEDTRHVWNMYNRVAQNVYVPAPASSWVYATGVYRYWNNDSAFRFDFVRGLNEDAVAISLAAVFSNSVKGFGAEISFDLDAATAPDANSSIGAGVSYEADYRVSLNAHYSGQPGAGRHFLAGLEYGGSSGVQTWEGTGFQCGIRGQFWC